MTDSVKVLNNSTPLMRQFWQIKSAHPDKIVFFRMGDFYEMFHDDAKVAAPLLGIALTSRNKKKGDETPMCGIPHYSVATPINKLLKVGLKVAICEQIEDPKQAKGLVRRAVTRILSPGVVFDPDTLDSATANYLASFDDTTVSFLEISTGEAFYFMAGSVSERELILGSHSPAELVLEKIDAQKILSQKTTGDWSGPCVTTHDFVHPTEDLSLPLSARRLLSFVIYMQGSRILSSLSAFELRRLDKRLMISQTAMRHLELFQSYEGHSNESLVSAIDRTQTSSGARLLKSWLRFPLCDPEELRTRHLQVDHWIRHPSELKNLRQTLSQLGDVERRLGRISSPSCNPRDVKSLTHCLEVGLATALQAQLKIKSVVLDEVKKLILTLNSTLVDEPPVSCRQCGIIRQGVSKELDELIELSTHGELRLSEMERLERQNTQIPSLKIRANNVFGYYIEVTNAHKNKIPSHYQRKQTLTSSERYTTAELTELESKILGSQSRQIELEDDLFERLRGEILKNSQILLGLAWALSELDVYLGLAWLAIERNYCAPQFLEKRGPLKLEGSRHPVVEQHKTKNFVANDINLNPNDCLLLTGPNMAGKSTLMRQIACTVIMAQMGSFVPARRAELPLYHQIFTRIGASDSLTKGLSTFMVEMTETSQILSSVTENSLVILDEIGRGTSTYDGLSLAQAILEHILEEKKCTTLFATHYHELTGLCQNHPQLRNAHMAIIENEGRIEFLYTLVRGAAEKSYGIQVAELAGIPAVVTQRARQILTGLETSPVIASTQNSPADRPKFEYDRLISELRSFPIQRATPLEALNKIAKWQQTLF